MHTVPFTNIAYTLLCPTEEDPGMLKSSVVITVNVRMDGKGKRGAVGARQGDQKWTVDSEHGASKGGSSLSTKSHHSK